MLACVLEKYCMNPLRHRVLEISCLLGGRQENRHRGTTPRNDKAPRTGLEGSVAVGAAPALGLGEFSALAGGSYETWTTYSRCGTPRRP